jgi:two-component system NtrC family sensor kinase
LNAAGYQVVTAAGGKEGLRIARDQKPVAIVLDVIMPDLDGLAVHAEMVARDPQLAKRFVFMTGGVLTSETREFLASLPGRLLEKPFAIDDLRELLRRKASA